MSQPEDLLTEYYKSGQGPRGETGKAERVGARRDQILKYQD
jgi:hypothetical protein